MKNLLIFGYFEKNLGDDLMLKIFVDKARLLYKRIYILTSREFKSYYENMGCKAICYNGLLYRIINRVFCRWNNEELYYTFLPKAKYDFVMLGGSLFMEGTEEQTQAQLRNLKRSVEKAQASFVIGSNFGPYTSADYIENYGNLFNKCVDVCFRDKYSYQLFKNLKNVRYAPDIVFSGEWGGDAKDEHILISLIDIRKRAHLKKYADSYEKIVLELCKYFLCRNEKVILFSMCEKEGDIEICHKIMSGLENKDNVEIKEYQEIDETLTLFKNAKKVYATRFHAMILGAYFSKPVVAIAYSEKMTNAVMSYDINCKIVELEELNSSFDINCILDHSVNASVEGVKKEALLQMKGFDNLLCQRLS